MKFDEPFIDAHQHFWDLGNNPYPWAGSILTKEA